MDKANTDWWGVKIKDEGKILFFIILSALLFRILAFFLTDRTNSDTVDYCLSAIYLHKGMIAEAVSVRNMYPMLYPLILSSAFYLGIAPITLGVIISIILGTAVVYIAYYISNLLFENRGISLIAAAFVAVSPPLIDSASSCLRDTPGLFSGALGSKKIKANAVIGIFRANSVGEDIEFYKDEKTDEKLMVFNNLRQQLKNQDEKYLSLGDFVAPKERGLEDYAGVFAATAGIGVDALEKEFLKQHDDYKAIMLKALADRLAEAFAEHLNELLVEEYWTSLKDIAWFFRGIRPAIGYPTSPDHSEKLKLFELLKAEENAGINLTEHFAMTPAASVCGFYFMNPKAEYFTVGRITKEQIEDYAGRKGVSVSQCESSLRESLSY